ncbi:ABC transporter [Streptomyces sp. TRM68367]|uniref:ABC transporter n=1 Tax=Streptomyces sp. TRM68367 TaxID=2758415 RepID=UPI0037DDD6B5
MPVLSLVRPVWRTLPWMPLAAGAGLGLLLVGIPRMRSGAADPWQGLTLLRGAALCFALGPAFLLDDPARHTTTPVPTPRPLRITLRLALVAPLAALWWTTALLLVPAQARPPLGDITLEAAGVAGCALAGAATAVRFTDRPEPGLAVTTALLTAAVATALLLPDDWTLLPAPGSSEWDAAHDRWTAMALLAALTWTAFAPEPLRRGPVLSGSRLCAARKNRI